MTCMPNCGIGYFVIVPNSIKTIVCYISRKKDGVQRSGEEVAGRTRECKRDKPQPEEEVSEEKKR